MNNPYVEVGYDQHFHHEGRICGDVFLSKKIKEENRIITVLSDGMGHGVKANVLGTLTATMAINFTEEHKDFTKIADIIMRTLPVCSERKVSYATFTIVDVEIDGQTNILEYDNPKCIIMRGTNILDVEWESVLVESPDKSNKILMSGCLKPQMEDRIIFFSDGVTQSGLGQKEFLLGWRGEKVEEFIKDIITKDRYISADKLASKIVNKAAANDLYIAHDDITCSVIYFREPRRLLICTGPPFTSENDAEYVRKLVDFKGKKILCGATTADIVSRELRRKIKDSFDVTDKLPPVSQMRGVDLITEGILTLSKVHEILEHYSPKTRLGNSPADQIVQLLLDSDEILFLVGTHVNPAHQDPTLPVDLEIRRTVVRRIERVLEKKFLKEVKIDFM